MSFRSFIVTLTFALLCAACSSAPKRTLLPGTQAATLQSTISRPDPELTHNSWNSRPSGQLAPGNEIEISEAADAKINGLYRITPEGELKLPYEKIIPAAGLSLSQLKTAISEAYSGILVVPTLKVQVRTKEFYVDVRGLVKKPGYYLVRKDSSLDELVSKAEGFLQSADGLTNQAQYARIEQLGVTNVIRLRDYYSGKKDLIPHWSGGESVFFQSERGDALTVGGAERNYVQVLGEVKNPADYPYIDNADFLHYLVKSGGPTERADLEHVNLIRTTGAGRELITFGLENAGEIPSIQPGDTLLVRADVPSPAEKKSRVIGGFAAIVQAVATIVLLFTV
jgi:protein involved in polysaccharide export with SLBB domain